MQFVATIGRNDPCPCGSGKKHKKCCGALAAAPPLPSSRLPPPLLEPLTWIVDEDEPLDVLSNSVIDLIADRRFDEALAACQRLLAEFPEVVDGLERSGMVHAAMGSHALAADFYRRALAYVTDPVRRHHYEIDGFYQEQIEKEERLAEADLASRTAPERAP